MRLSYIVASLVVCVFAAGCNSTPQTHEESKQLAQKRFNHQKARAKYLLALEQFSSGQIKKARESAEAAIGLYQDEPEYFMLLAKIYLEEGELGKAGSVLASASTPGGPTAEACYVSGLVAERVGKSAEALGYYRRAHELDPFNAGYVMACGELLISLNRPEETLELISERLLDNDARGQFHVLRGEALAMLKRYNEAADAYRRALIDAPQDDSLLDSLAGVLVRAGRHADAIPPLRALQALLKNDTPRHIRRMLAECYLETGDAATALAMVRELTNLNDSDARAWALLARCHLALNQLPDAEFAAQRAVALAPGVDVPQTVLGLVLFKQEKWIDARRTLEAVVAGHPDQGIALCLLGQVCEALGSPGLALEYYRRALRVDAGDDLARQLHDQLAAAPADQS